MSRFRLYPTANQEALLLEHCAHARFVWNLALEQRLMWRRWQGATPGLVAQGRQLTEARAAEPWLRAGSVTIQQQALRDHDAAWRYFFNGTHARPKWRKRGRHEGFRVVGKEARPARHHNRRWSSVFVPKVGWVKYRSTRAIEQCKSYRITRTPTGCWHVTFPVRPEPIQAPGTGEVVGIDRGIKAAVALSTGEISSPPRLRTKEAERLLRLMRTGSRRKPHSRRRQAATRAAARVKARETSRRKDWIEKTSTDLARRFDVIRIEDLRVGQMTRSARGTRGAPGRRVRQKQSLNRGILSNGWSMLATRLEQKAIGRVEKVPPQYTSQTCHACGHVAADNRKSQAIFCCTGCGHHSNADVNAACNIAAGRAVTARGDLAHQGRSMKREPAPMRLPAA